LRFGKAPDGTLNEEDVVQAVITKLLTGERRWNKKKIPAVDKQVFLGITSYIRNEYKRIKSSRQIEFVNYDNKKSLKMNDYRGLMAGYILEDLEDEKYNTDAETMKQECLKELEVNNDVIGYYVLEKMKGFNESNVDIAESLKIDVNEVVYAKKRIRTVAYNLYPWKKRMK
jgi:hypothetical protein